MLRGVLLAALNVLGLPLLLLFYVALPRLVLTLSGAPAEVQFSTGYTTLNLSWLLVLAAAYQFTARWKPRLAAAGLLAIVNVALFIQAIESGLMHFSGMGFSVLFFSYFELESLRLAFLEYWPVFLAVAALVAASAALAPRWILAPLRPGASRIVLVLAFLLAVRSVYLIANEFAGRAPGRYSPVVSLLTQASHYFSAQGAVSRLQWDEQERRILKGAGIDPDPGRPPPYTVAPPGPRWNLILVYLESFQADFTAHGGSPYPDLTPHLDQFAGAHTFLPNYFNAATPTINSLISSQCGVIPAQSFRELQAEDFQGVRQQGMTCLTDVLHANGYRNVFLLGDKRGFVARHDFLMGHHVDEEKTWEDWVPNAAYFARRTAWGLQDTDLMAEALAAIDRLHGQGPFALTLMTLNSHTPGYTAPECPVYRPDNRLLNGIHCADYAFGILYEGLKRRGVLRDTVVVAVGDHMLFPAPYIQGLLGKGIASSYYGRTFFAFHGPTLHEPARPTIATYTPDIAPTVLDLLGLPGPSWTFGKSALGERARFPHLVAPLYEVLDGEMRPATVTSVDLSCEESDIARIVLRTTQGFFTGCERKKIIEGISLLTALRALR